MLCVFNHHIYLQRMDPLITYGHKNTTDTWFSYTRIQTHVPVKLLTATKLFQIKEKVVLLVSLYFTFHQSICFSSVIHLIIHWSENLPALYVINISRVLYFSDHLLFICYQAPPRDEWINRRLWCDSPYSHIQTECCHSDEFWKCWIPCFFSWCDKWTSFSIILIMECCSC